MTGFRRRLEFHHGIESTRFQSFAVKLGFSTRRSKVAIRKGKERSVDVCAHFLDRASVGTSGDAHAYLKVEPDMSLAFKSLAINALEPGILRIESEIDDLVDGLFEALLLKSHALGQRTKDFNVGPALGQRL